MEEGYVPCPICKGKAEVPREWEFVEGTTEDIRRPVEGYERCTACRDSKYPGYVYMPPAVWPDGTPHYTKYYDDHRQRYY